MNRETWHTFKMIFLLNSEIFSLVCSWIDHAEPSTFITKWQQRYFLARLVERAFRELTHNHSNVVEVVVLEGSSHKTRISYPLGKGLKVYGWSTDGSIPCDGIIPK
jgi:hypothetical protein